jgi:flagellin
MANSINTNIAAYSAQANIAKAANAATTSVSRLSSGNFITKASDDVARLSIGTSFSTTVRTLRQALVNAAQGVSLLQVADGALGQITEILQRQKTLAVQASSGNLSNTDRSFLNQEFQALSQQIDFITQTTSFNGVSLIDGSLSTSSRIDDSTKQASAARGTIGLSANLAAGDAIVINGVTFTARNTLDADPAIARQEFLIGSTASDTVKNLADKLSSLTSSNAATIDVSTTTYAQKLGAASYKADNGVLTISARSGGALGERFTINTAGVTSGSVVSVSGAFGGTTINLFTSSSVSNFTSATASVVASSSGGQSATSPFLAGNSLSLTVGANSAQTLYTYVAGDSLTTIANGINSNAGTTGVTAKLVGNSTAGYNIELSTSKVTGNNISINGGNDYFKVAATGLQASALTSATSSTHLLSTSYANTLTGATDVLVSVSGSATEIFANGANIFASVAGGTFSALLDSDQLLETNDTIEGVIEKINSSSAAGALGIRAVLASTGTGTNNNISLVYNDATQSGAIAFRSGTAAGTQTLYNADATGKNYGNGLGGSFATFNLLSTGVTTPDESLVAGSGPAVDSVTPFFTNSVITIKRNLTASTQETLQTYTIVAGQTLQSLATALNADPEAIAAGLHYTVAQDSAGRYNIQATYAASAAPTAGTSGGASATGIEVEVTNSALAASTEATLTVNTNATASSRNTTYRLFNTDFAQTLTAGQTIVTAGASGAAGAPLAGNNTMTVILRDSDGNNSSAINLLDSGNSYTTQNVATLADLVREINAYTGTSNFSAALDANGTNIILSYQGTAELNPYIQINGGAGLYTPPSTPAYGDGATEPASPFNNSYAYKDLFDSDVTGGVDDYIAEGPVAAGSPFDNGEDLVIQIDGLTTVTINITATETLDSLVTQINNNADARAIGLKAYRTGTNSTGNIRMYITNADYATAGPTSWAFTAVNADGLLNNTTTSTHVAVDNILSNSSSVGASTKTPIASGITNTSTFGLSGGVDNGLGYGSTTVTGAVSDDLLTALAQKSAQAGINFVDTDASALTSTFSGKTVTVAGSTFTFVATKTLANEIAIGSSLQQTLDNAVSTITRYGRETATGDAAYMFNQMDVSRSGNSLLFTGKGISNVVNLAGSALTDIDSDVANKTLTNSGDLNNATRTGTGTFGVDVSAVSNAAFTGKISGFEATYSGTANTVSMRVKIGENTYTATNVNTNPLINGAGVDANGNQIVRFYSDTYEDANGKEINGGFFDIQLAAGKGSAVSSDAQATAFADRLDSAFQGLNFNQKRVISSYTGTGSIINASGATVGSLVGSSVSAQLPTFEANKMTNISVTAPPAGSVDAQISLTIDGVQYTSRAIGSTLGANQTYKLTSATDPNYFVNFTTGNTAIDLSTTENAQALEKALSVAFGTDAGSAALSFQIGTSSKDSLGVNIGAATTDSLFEGKVLNIGTLADASRASDAIDIALATVTSIRASVGALQSRFNFASANIQISAQNQDASRSELLDTDIAQESTSYATAQVQLQAGISVLAQANQQLQALLKLLG